MTGPAFRLEDLVSVSDLTREANRHRRQDDEPITVRQMKYRLKLLDARVRREARAGGGERVERWGVIVRLSESPTGKIFVRKSALKKYAPELFELDLATSQEVGQMRRENHVMRQKYNALAAEVRELKAFRRKAHEWFASLDQNRPKLTKRPP
jgi:tRNA A37 N6-isopentenylltransferase MiaA